MFSGSKYEKVRYHVTIIHSQAESNYSHQKNSPVHRSGKEFGKEESEWNLISIPILKTMSQIAEGCEITGSQKKVIVKDNNMSC